MERIVVRRTANENIQRDNMMIESLWKIDDDDDAMVELVNTEATTSATAATTTAAVAVAHDDDSAAATDNDHHTNVQYSHTTDLFPPPITPSLSTPICNGKFHLSTVLVDITTGRTHQIRKHMDMLGDPPRSTHNIPPLLFCSDKLFPPFSHYVTSPPPSRHLIFPPFLLSNVCSLDFSLVIHLFNPQSSSHPVNNSFTTTQCRYAYFRRSYLLVLYRR